MITIGYLLHFPEGLDQFLQYLPGEIKALLHSFKLIVCAVCIYLGKILTDSSLAEVTEASVWQDSEKFVSHAPSCRVKPKVYSRVLVLCTTQTGK